MSQKQIGENLAVCTSMDVIEKIDQELDLGSGGYESCYPNQA
jgi:hypothetical protein